jgi:micrococcal nuclease
VVESVKNGKSFTLEDGTVVRLALLQVPNVQEEDGKQRPGQPMGEEARRALSSLVKGQKVKLQTGKEPRDHHNRLIAFATREDGTNVQEWMVREGWAMVYGFADNRDKLPPLLKLETQARAAKRGIWKHPYWQVKDAATLKVNEDRYLLMEGVPTGVAKVKNTWYINFDEDWKTDTTAQVSAGDYRRFKKQDLSKLVGKKLLLRGWVYERNGPMMDIVLPEQISIQNAESRIQ